MEEIGIITVGGVGSAQDDIRDFWVGKCHICAITVWGGFKGTYFGLTFGVYNYCNPPRLSWAAVVDFDNWGGDIVGKVV